MILSLHSGFRSYVIVLRDPEPLKDLPDISGSLEYNTTQHENSMSAWCIYSWTDVDKTLLRRHEVARKFTGDQSASMFPKKQQLVKSCLVFPQSTVYTVFVLYENAENCELS